MRSSTSYVMTASELDPEDLVALIRISNKYRVGIHIGDRLSEDCSFLIKDPDSLSSTIPSKSLASRFITENSATLKELKKLVTNTETIQTQIFTNLSQILQDCPEGKLKQSISDSLMEWENTNLQTKWE